MLLCLFIAAVSLALPGAILMLLARFWAPWVLTRFILSGGRSETLDRAAVFCLWGLASVAIFAGLWGWLAP